jgi:hypothetical protein
MHASIVIFLAGHSRIVTMPAAAHHSHHNYGISEFTLGDTVKVRCHRLRDGSNGCLLGFLTPIHGDTARGYGAEKKWD